MPETTVRTVTAPAYLVCPGCGVEVEIEVPVDVWYSADPAEHPRIEVTSSWDSPIADQGLQSHCTANKEN